MRAQHCVSLADRWWRVGGRTGGGGLIELSQPISWPLLTIHTLVPFVNPYIMLGGILCKKKSGKTRGKGQVRVVGARPGRARRATPPRRDAARRLVLCRVASHGIAATWQVGIEAVQLVMRMAKNEQQNTHESSAGHDAQERELQQRRNSASNLRALSNALGGEASNEGMRRNDEAADGLCSRAIAFYHIPAVVFLLRFAAHILHVGVRAPQI